MLVSDKAIHFHFAWLDSCCVNKHTHESVSVWTGGLRWWHTTRHWLVRVLGLGWEFWVRRKSEKRDEDEGRVWEKVRERRWKGKEICVAQKRNCEEVTSKGLFCARRRWYCASHITRAFTLSALHQLLRDRLSHCNLIRTYCRQKSQFSLLRFACRHYVTDSFRLSAIAIVTLIRDAIAFSSVQLTFRTTERTRSRFKYIPAHRREGESNLRTEQWIG